MEQVEKDVEAALQNVSSLLNVHSHLFLYSSSVLPAVPDDSSLYLYILMPILDSVTATARDANYLTVSPMKDTLCDQCVGPTEFMLAKVLRRGRAYGLSFSSERTIKSNHLQKQHFLLSYLKTLSVGPAGVKTSGFSLYRPCLCN